ncbi:MAG: thioredoxin family protein, partial [Acetobacteraceae bacterium]
MRGRVSTVAAAALALVAIVAPSLSSEAFTTPDPTATTAAGNWTRFDPAGLHSLVSGGHIVFVNVSADWCLICKVNEIAVLGRRPVSNLLRGASVVAMRADWTRPDPSITAYLQSFGRYGVPLDVVYGPGAPNGIALPELLTSGAVKEAFHRAGGPAREASR